MTPVNALKFRTLQLTLCVFTVAQIGDMSLADNATLCLSAVITQVAEVNAGEQIYRDVIQHTVLDAVLKGLRSKNDVRNMENL